MNSQAIPLNASRSSSTATGSTVSPVHVVMAVDRTFLPYTAVAIASAALATPDLSIHLLHDGSLGRGEQALAKLADAYGAAVQSHLVDINQLAELPVFGHVSLATYYRLAIAELLPADLRQIIYLDSDIIVRQSLAPLYSTQVDQNGVAAVPEPNAHVVQLGFSPETPYFNAGVLVLDLSYWRQHKVGKSIYELAITNREKLKFWDQDALAIYLQGSWTHLPAKWNVHHRYFFGNNRLPMIDTDPCIVHFSGQGLKPPDQNLVHPFADEFWEFAEMVRPYGFTFSRRQWLAESMRRPTVIDFRLLARKWFVPASSNRKAA